MSVKSHANGTKNPKAHLRKAITEADALNAPMIAEPLGLFDCCGVSDGAAAAIVTTPEIAKQLGKHNIVAVSTAIGAVERFGVRPQQLGRQLFPYDADRREQGVQRGRHREAARSGQYVRVPRLLFDH